MPDGGDFPLMLAKEAVNRFVMAKSHLLPGTRLDSAGAVVRGLVAMDAGSLDDAYFSLYLRVRRFDAAALEKGLYRGGGMARVRGLRNGLQLVSREYLPAVYALSRGCREASARSLLETWGIGEDEYRAVERQVLESLGSGEKTLAQLKSGLRASSREITRRRGEKALNVSIVSRAMQDRWLLLRGGIGRRPGENPGRFSAFRGRFPIGLDMGRGEALSLLAKRYLEAYGPVAAGDLAWWLGITRVEAVRALEGLGCATAVEVEGVDGRLFVDSDDLGKIGGLFEEQSVLFLPGDDPYVKAYSSHARLAPPGFDALTRFGESKRVVLVNGEIRGTWALVEGLSGHACEVRMFEDVAAERGPIEKAAGDAGRFYTGGPVAVDVRAGRPG